MYKYSVLNSNDNQNNNGVMLFVGFIIVIALVMFMSDKYNINIKPNDIITYIAIIGGLVLFAHMLKQFEKMNNTDENLLKEQYENLSIPKIDKNICSRECCKFTQWPVPFNTHEPSDEKSEYDKYIGSNFSCNLGQTGGGCVCVEKSDYEYLSNHGQV
jgi:hypothetical protein